MMGVILILVLTYEQQVVGSDLDTLWPTTYIYVQGLHTYTYTYMRRIMYTVT